jgi:tetratricopeptide (TPR) repeat protein
LARDKLRTALVALDDPLRTSSERLEAYRGDLQSADALLTHMLRFNPLDVMGIARVAGIRCDLASLGAAPSGDTEGLLELALLRAGSSTNATIEIAELSLRIGRDKSAFTALGRIVNLEPDSAPRAIEVLRGAGVDLDRIVSTLPNTAQVRVALFGAFEDAGRLADYFDLASTSLESASWKQISMLGTTANLLGRHADLKARLDQIGKLVPIDAEAERLAQLALCEARLGFRATALEHAQHARSYFPHDPRFAEIAAIVAQRVGALELAERTAREALTIYAAMPNSSQARGRLYRLLGEILEATGRVGDAYDAYRRALGSDPDDASSAQRVADIERGTTRP